MPQIGGEPLIDFSCVQDGWMGEGNISDNPRFVDAEDGDYRLTEFSPCIDAGDSELLVCDRSESIDLVGEPRYREDKRVVDTGRGLGAIVDMGALEASGLVGLRLGCIAPLQAGESSDITVSQGRPGEVVHIVYGFAAGATTIPGCRPQQVQIDQARLLGSAACDEAGHAVLRVFVPPGLAGRTVRIQMIERSSCRVSNLATVTLPN